MKTVNFSLKREIIAFYCISGLYACFFATGNWYFLWNRFLSNGGIGLVDSLCFLIGFLIEVPSGALADLFGRKRILLIAVTLMGFGYSLMGLASGGGHIILGYLIYKIGSSFYSGADDALMYDHLKSNSREDLWKSLTTKKHLITRFFSLIATFVGGTMFALDFRLPSLVRGGFFFIMIVPLLVLPENHGKKVEGMIDLREYGRHVKDGMKQLLLPNLVKVLPLMVLTGTILSTLFVSGVLRPILFAHAGYGGVDQSYLLGTAGFITVIVLLIYQKYLSKISSQTLVWCISILTLVCFGAMSGLEAEFWLPFLMGVQILNGILAPTASDLVNREVDSSHRATALSGLALLQDAPYILLAPLLGMMAQAGLYQMIVMGISIVIVITIVGSYFLNKCEPRTG